MGRWLNENRSTHHSMPSVVLSFTIQHPNREFFQKQGYCEMWYHPVIKLEVTHFKFCPDWRCRGHWLCDIFHNPSKRIVETLRDDKLPPHRRSQMQHADILRTTTPPDQVWATSKWFSSRLISSRSLLSAAWISTLVCSFPRFFSPHFSRVELVSDSGVACQALIPDLFQDLPGGYYHRQT